MERGAWRDTVHGATKSWTQLKQVSTRVFVTTSWRSKPCFFNIYAPLEYLLKDKA